jgi:hypothetical protein
VPIYFKTFNILHYALTIPITLITAYIKDTQNKLLDASDFRSRKHPVTLAIKNRM